MFQMYKDVWSLMRKKLNPVILQNKSPRAASGRQMCAQGRRQTDVRCTVTVSSGVVAVVRRSRRVVCGLP